MIEGGGRKRYKRSKEDNQSGYGTNLLPDKNAARVKFDDKGGIISAPLKVIRRPRSIVPGRSDQEGGKTAIAEGHSHAAYVTDWVPQVNDMVVCIYVPGGDGDGFILGKVM